MTHSANEVCRCVTPSIVIKRCAMCGLPPLSEPTSTPSELLPCPGCGTMNHSLKEDELTGFGHFRECDCGWAGPIRLSGGEANEAWNCRAK